jgi:hypothetical protein
VQFTKPEGVLSGMGLDLGKTEQALAGTARKGPCLVMARELRLALTVEDFDAALAFA